MVEENYIFLCNQCNFERDTGYGWEKISGILKFNLRDTIVNDYCVKSTVLHFGKYSYSLSCLEH